MMKDRLMELIKDTLQEWECDVSEKTISEIAEHLIKNGVIAPTCKVGQKIYQSDGVRIYESTIRNVTYETKDIVFDERAIGKSIFLTREEAEQALKGGAEK